MTPLQFKKIFIITSLFFLAFSNITFAAITAPPTGYVTDKIISDWQSSGYPVYDGTWAYLADVQPTGTRCGAFVCPPGDFYQEYWQDISLNWQDAAPFKALNGWHPFSANPCAAGYELKKAQAETNNDPWIGQNTGGAHMIDSIRYTCGVSAPPVSYTLQCKGEPASTGSGSRFMNIKWTATYPAGFTPKTFTWGGDVIDTNYGGGQTNRVTAYSYSSINDVGRASVTGTATYNATGAVVSSSNSDNSCSFAPVQKLTATCSAMQNVIKSSTGAVTSNVTFTGNVDKDNSTAYTWTIGGRTYTGKTVNVLGTSGQTVSATVRATANFSDPRATYTLTSTNTNNTCSVVAPSTPTSTTTATSTSSGGTATSTTVGGIGGSYLDSHSAKYSVSNGNDVTQVSGSYQDAINNNLQELRDLAVTDDHETVRFSVAFSNGVKTDYNMQMPVPGSGSNGGGNIDTLLQNIMSDAGRNGGVSSITDIHNHPNDVVYNLYITPTSVGYPPSSEDLASLAVNLRNKFPNASITNLAIDGWNIWQYSVPSNSAFYKDLMSAANAKATNQGPVYAPSLLSVANYDMGRLNNYYGAGDSTRDYLNAVRASGAVIRNVTSRYPKVK